MEYDRDKVDEMVLALLSLTLCPSTEKSAVGTVWARMSLSWWVRKWSQVLSHAIRMLGRFALLIWLPVDGQVVAVSRAHVEPHGLSCSALYLSAGKVFVLLAL